MGVLTFSTRIRVSVAMLAAVSALAAEDPSMSDPRYRCTRGPLRIRNQFPLNLHHLSFAGEDASPVGSRRWSVSLDTTTANVFSATEDLQRLHEGGPRRPLTREEFQELVVRDPSRDQFLFDGGVSRLGLQVRYGVADRVELGLELPYLSLGGGALDALIEGFHDTFGLSQSGRTGYPRNELEAALYVGGQALFVDGGQAESGLGDPVLSAKVLLVRETHRFPNLAVRLSVKPPLHREGSLLSSGRTDFGADLLASKHFYKQSLYLNAGYVRDGGWWALPGLPRSNVWTILVAYEVWLTSRSSFIIQNLTHSSFLARATDSELAEVSHEVSAGVKLDAPGHLGFSLSLTENYGTFKSSPDFGLHAGVVCSF